jgi:hypothetical protein
MKKFLICLLVVAIALLGFTGCPSPASDDDSGSSGLSNRVDLDVPALEDEDLQNVNSILVPYAAAYVASGVTPVDWTTIIGIVDGIETSSLTTGWVGPVGGRAADDYEYNNEDSSTVSREWKSQNYPVYNQSYNETWGGWVRQLQDGQIAFGDTYEGGWNIDTSAEYSKITIKPTDFGTLITGGSYNTNIDGVFGGGNNFDVKIDGKATMGREYSYTDEYTKVSDDHVDYYYTHTWDGSDPVIKRVYSFDTLDTTAGAFSGQIPDYEKVPSQAGAFGFRLRYEYTPTTTDGEIHYKVLANKNYPVSITSGKTITDPVIEPALTDPMPFEVTVQLQGRKGLNTLVATNGPSYKTALGDLIPATTLTTWNDLIAFARKRDVARDLTGAATYSVTQPTVGWLVFPYYAGKSKYDGSSTIDNYQDAYDALPANVRSAIDNQTP